MHCGESDFTIIGPQNYGPHFTHTSALTVRKFRSAFYPLMVPHVRILCARIAKIKLTPAKALAVNIHDIYRVGQKKTAHYTLVHIFAVIYLC